MKVVDFIILGIILSIAAFVLYRMIKKRKNGGGCNCGCCNSGSCTFCDKRK